MVSRKEWLIRAALIAGSLFVAVLIAEIAYRIKIANNPYKPMRGQPERFTASPIVFGLYDRETGVRYAPGSSHHIVSLLEDGHVIWAPEEPIAACNADGFVGRTLKDEYAHAGVKIVTFGDSFTNWRQDGDTWPDLLQRALGAKLGGKSVAVLNAARGGYGVLQMFDLAARTVPELKPDLAVIAFITDDLSRSRWWTRATEWNGYTRPLQSPSPDSFQLDTAIDEYIVNPKITPEWAKAALEDPTKGEPLLSEIIAQYRAVKDDFHRARNLAPIERSPWSLHEFFLWNRITTGMPVRDHVASIPRLEFTDFAEDARFVKAVERLRESGIPVLLLHVPVSVELTQKEPSFQIHGWFGYSRRDRLLAESLVRVTGWKIDYLENELEGITLPEKLDLQPFNGHPNHAGLELYGELAARVIAKTLP